MTKLSILSAAEQRQFDSPPNFEDIDRNQYFAVNNEVFNIIQNLRTPINQIGFTLQLGYFKANGKFFTAQQFRKSDIEYVSELLGFNSKEIDILAYQNKAIQIHRRKILALLHWQPLNNTQQEKIKNRIGQLVQQHLSLKQIFLSLIDFCWQSKIELPSYNQLSTFITQAYNNFEMSLVKIIDQSLSLSQQTKLQHMAGLEKQSKGKMQRNPLTLIKHFNQSLRPLDIQENIEAFKFFKEPFHEFKSIFHKLNLSDQATEYFATWIQKSTNFQLTQFANKNKVFQIEGLVDIYNAQNTPIQQTHLIELENSLDKISNNQLFFDSLESLSLKLQRRVAGIVKNLEFNPQTSDPHIFAAIHYFVSCDGELGNEAPCDFMKIEEKELCYNQGKLRVSLYKTVLFMHMAEAIKAGRLNLLYSYRYKAIQDYLIDEETWKSQRQSLLKSAGLDQFENFKETTGKLKEQLDNKYQRVNERFLKGENSFLTVDENHKVKITTPKTESSEEEYTFSLLSQAGFIPILRVLTDIEQVTQFTGSFRHFSVKHKKMKPNSETVFAGLLGKGCNIGLNRLANISIASTI